MKKVSDDHIIDCAKQMAITHGADNYCPTLVAQELNISIARAYDCAPDLLSILNKIITQAQRKTIEQIQIEDLQEHTKDRLLDTMMNFFEALQPHKQLLQAARDYLKRGMDCIALYKIFNSIRYLRRISGYNNNPMDDTMFVLQVMQLMDDWLFDEQMNEEILLAKLDNMV